MDKSDYFDLSILDNLFTGELVFTTQYTGYEEALTDLSYKGQILIFTYPLIGNYFISGDTFQSDCMQAEGLVKREACDHPSHHKSMRSIFEYLRDEGEIRHNGHRYKDADNQDKGTRNHEISNDCWQ